MDIVEYKQSDIQKYICPTATEKEFFEFCQIVKARNLNPFLKEVHFVKYGNSAGQIVVGKDAIIKRAKTIKGYRGFKSGWFNDKGEKLDFPVGQILGAWCEVYADEKEPLMVSVLMSEYNSNQSIWKTKPATMIRKVAVVQAHREFSPEETSGLYDEVEISEPVEQKKDVKKLLQKEPVGEWMAKLLNIKKDPNFKEAIQELAKEKKFKTGKDEESAEYNFNLIVGFEKVEKVFDGSKVENTNIVETGDEYF